MKPIRLLPSRASVLALLAPLAAFAQSLSIELPNGQQVPVERIAARPNGSLVVTINGQPRDFTREQYVRAIGVRPPQLEEANALLAQGKREEAEAKLTEAFRSAMFQSWDAIAAVSLVNLQVEMNNASGAKRTLDTVLERYGNRATTLFPQLVPLQWRVRMAQGETTALDTELTALVDGNGDRNTQAQALLVRGDIKRKRADLKAAILDYLRVTHFYPGDDAASAEALFKVGTTFQELGENANARRYFNELREKYPQSEFSSRAPAN